jgi:hypothetical protein
LHRETGGAANLFQGKEIASGKGFALPASSDESVTNVQHWQNSTESFVTACCRVRIVNGPRATIVISDVHHRRTLIVFLENGKLKASADGLRPRYF